MANDTAILPTHDQEKLNAETVAHISRLAMLATSAEQQHVYAAALNKVLALMDVLASINTEEAEPMHSPFAVAQPLRDDVVTEINKREDYQKVAPSVAEGCYLVPKVIE